MKIKKQNKELLASEVLQKKSDNAVEVIRAIITDLRGAADEANNTVAENNARIEEIKKENEALNAIGEKNIRIVNNLETLFG